MSYPGKMLNDGLCDPPVIDIPARQLLKLIYARVLSTGDICGYGTGVVNSEESIQSSVL